MSDEFLITVAVGIGILALLLIITNVFFVFPKEAPQVEVLSKSIALGDFKASFMKETRTYELGSKDIYNGVLFGESKVRYHFDAPSIESAVIRFRVSRTNNLAPLFVKVNGEAVESKLYAVGEYTVEVPEELLNESMTVEIYAYSSLWQIWAPNLYDLRDITITVKAFDFQPFIAEFDLAEEYLTFKEGRIEFSLDDNTGRVAVVLNDNEIFNDYARSAQSVVFTKEQAKVGTNRLKLVPSLGSRFLGTARAVVFYEAPVKK